MSELYKLPAGWEWKKLGDNKVCSLNMGQSPNSKSYNSNKVGMPFFQGKKEFGDLYPTVEQYTIEPKKIAEKGDILLSVRAPVGPTNIANIQCCIGRGLSAISPNKENTITNYLLYFFRNFELAISNKGKGSTFSAITKKELEETDIPLPPLVEQKRIVAKLDNLFEKIDKAIELHQQNITNANTLMASTLDKTFKKLEGECSKIALLDVMKISNKTLVPDDNQKYNYVGLENIEGNTGRLIDFCETQGKEIKSSKVEFKKGMVLYGKLRPYLNKVWFSEFDGVATTEILPFYPIDNTRLNMIFVKYYFLSSSYLQRVMRNCSGSRMPRLTTAFLKSEEAYIPLPPLPIQQQTVEYLDSIATKVDKIKQLNEQKLENLKALKASILDKAFRGEL